MNDIEFAQSLSPELAALYVQAKELAFTTPAHALTFLRSFAAVFCETIEPSTNDESNLNRKIARVREGDQASTKVLSYLRTLQESGNKAAHPEQYDWNVLDFPALVEEALLTARYLLGHLFWLRHGHLESPEYTVSEPTRHIQRDLSHRAIFDEDPEARYTLGVHFKEKADRQLASEQTFRIDDGYGAFSNSPSRQTIDQAIHWFKCAAESSHPGALYEYGAYLSRLKDHPDGTKSREEDRVHGEIKVWWACQEGHADAQALMGDFFFSGSTRQEIDYARARELYQQAAEQSHPRALAQLGRMHEQGLGGPKDLKAALQCSLQAAEAGFPQAQFHLYTLHRKGHAFVRDLPTVLHWLTEAAEQKFPDAMFALADLIAKKQLPDRTIEDAQELYKQCINTKHLRITALYALANLVATYSEELAELVAAQSYIFQCAEEVQKKPEYRCLLPGCERIASFLFKKMNASLVRTYPNTRFQLEATADCTGTPTLHGPESGPE